MHSSEIPECLPKPSSWDFECMAWHEAGHAAASLVLPEREPIVRISIEPGDEAFGFMRTAPRPHHNETIVSLRSTMAVFFAGPLAERHFLHRVTTSGMDDLSMARSIARDMVLRFGMGPSLGIECPVGPDELVLASQSLRHSVESDMRRLLTGCSRMAMSTLRRNAQLIQTLARALLKRRTLSRDDLDQILPAGF